MPSFDIGFARRAANCGGTNAKGDGLTNGNEAIPFGEPLTGRLVPTVPRRLND